jgi:hemerythrin-like metal-binding protein
VDFTPFDPHAADLGVPAMDAEHRGQIELMNRAGKAIASGALPAAIAQEVGKLAGYLDVHFMSELIAMREQGYPGYEEHVAEHDQAIELLHRLKDRCAQGDAPALLELLGALNGWLVGHIRSADAEFARFGREGSAAGD